MVTNSNLGVFELWHASSAKSRVSYPPLARNNPYSDNSESEHHLSWPQNRRMTMYRSFTDRVLGGVCGGLAAVFPINAWVFRAAFMVLSIVTSGAFAALYILLWWFVPQESLVGRRGG